MQSEPFDRRSHVLAETPALSTTSGVRILKNLLRFQKSDFSQIDDENPPNFWPISLYIYLLNYVYKYTLEQLKIISKRYTQQLYAFTFCFNVLSESFVIKITVLLQFLYENFQLAVHTMYFQFVKQNVQLMGYDLIVKSIEYSQIVQVRIKLCRKCLKIL